MNKEEFIIKFYSCDDEEQFLKDVYHNLNCLQQENQQLKIQISAREEEYRKLEDNWNKLKEYIKQEPTSDFYNDKLPFEVIMVKIINKMQELERGVSDEI